MCALAAAIAVSLGLAADSVQVPEGVINEIGSYDGTVFFKVTGSEAALVEVTADGAWSLTPQ